MDDTGKQWATPDGWGAPPPASPPPGSSFGQPAGQAESATAPTYGAWGPPQRPEVKPGVVPLRPLGLGEILDGVVGIVRRYPRPTLGLAALVALVSTVLNAVLLLTALQPFLAFDPTALQSGDSAAFDGAIGGTVAAGGASGLLSLLANVVLTGIITAVVGRAVLGQPMTLAEAWAQVRPRLLPLLGLALLVPLIVFGVLLVPILVGAGVIAAAGGLGALVAVPLFFVGAAAAVYLYVRLSLAPCALVLEKVGVRASLSRSGVLVKRDWWRVLGILLLAFLIAQTVSTLLQLPFAASSFTSALSGDFSPPSTTDILLSSIGGGIALTLVAPFTAGVRALLYVDRRMRAEGLDVALAAAADGNGR